MFVFVIINLVNLNSYFQVFKLILKFKAMTSSSAPTNLLEKDENQALGLSKSI